MTFHVQTTTDASVIEVEDDLDAFNSPGLEKAIAVAEPGNERIVVSLENCDYCDSTALAVLIRAKKRLRDRLLIVVPKDGSVRRIFEITELIGVLDIADTMPDSLRIPPIAS